MLGIMIMSVFNFDTAQTKSREYMHAFYHHNFICGKHFNDGIISLRGDVWSHKTSLV